MYIYKITNLINGKCYIGQTQKSIKERWANHNSLSKNGHISLIKKAIIKYGKESFKVEQIEQCSSIEELNNKEIYYIKHYNSISPNGYNLEGGGKNKIVHASSKLKMALAKIGKKHPMSQKARDKLAITRMGMKFSDEHRASLSAARKDKKRVKCIQNNTIYESFSEAAKTLKIPVQRVSQCANGKRKSAYGFSFEAVNEQ